MMAGREQRTSESHPIDVAWLAAPARGAVGLTFAPGKHARSLTGPAWARDLDVDLRRLREHHRADALVCLLEEDELTLLGIPTYVERVAHHGMALHRLPIRDGDVPASTSAVRALLRSLRSAVEHGDRVVAHCRGGLGRAGTIGGCLLIELGLSPEEALEALKARHPETCPETDAQRAFIRAYSPSPR